MVEDFAGFLAGAGVELVEVLAHGVQVLHVLGEVLQGDVEAGATREQVAVVAVVLDLPGVGRDLLGGEVGLVHRDLAAVGVFDHGIVVGGEVDGGDGRPDGGGVNLRDAVLDVEGAAGADARRGLAAGLFGEGARLVGAGERGGFLIELSRLGVVLLDTGARLVDSK